MTYCTYCGEKNVADGEYCVKCGANLKGLPKKSVEERFEKSIEESAEQFGEHMEKWGEDMGKRAENDCFGIPRGGTIVGLLIGIIIIIVGLQQVFGWQIDVGPFVIIIVGLLFIVGAIYGLTRTRR
jgi:uncharacterized membrane protein YvbJ